MLQDNTSDGYFMQFVRNMPSFSSQKLCEVIITSRYLGSLQDEAVFCMTELANRRASGEQFDYETIIEEGIKKLPNFHTNLKKSMNTNLVSALRNLK